MGFRALVGAASSTEMANTNPNAAVWLINGYTPGDAAVGVLAAKMGATPYPSIPQMGLLHGAMSDEMVEFLQGNESAEKALEDIEAAYIAKAKEQGFLNLINIGREHFVPLLFCYILKIKI